ncbi:MAG TPA: outer membrane beta-barrel protein, partial [Agriterribacter sp.]|nr:outer membrane beta-barrel protein [Agriterribacter sp.]
MLNTGVIVKSPLGASGLPVYSLNDPSLDSAFAGGKVARKLRYFNVPVMMKYKFKNNLYVKGGIQLGLRSKAFDEFTNEIIDEKDLEYKLKIKDQFHPLDAGLAFGVGYRLMGGNGMNMGLQYYLGLVDVVIDDTSPNQYNRSLYLTVGIPIGKSSKKTK